MQTLQTIDRKKSKRDDKPMPIYIWVRATTDWSDEAAFNAQLHPSFAGKVQLWNRTFSLSYHIFRHRVCEIASRNHAAVADVVRAPWDAIPDGALVVPGQPACRICRVGRKVRNWDRSSSQRPAPR